MPRVIELRPEQAAGAPLALQSGDLLLCWAIGGRVVSGGEAVEMLGPFQVGVPVEDGRILAPEGPPSRTVFLARGPGTARVELFAGGPGTGGAATVLTLTVG
ncbi:hypothetical protein GCM10022221_31190 [Actinocorallia aurea]